MRDLSEAISLSVDLGDWVQRHAGSTERQAQLNLLDGFIEKWADTANRLSLKAQAEALAGNGVTLMCRLAGLTAGAAAYDDFVRKLGIVEHFMGLTYGGGKGQACLTPLDAASGSVTVSLSAEQIACISLAYDRFKGDIYEALVPETRLSAYAKLLLEDSQDASQFAVLETVFRRAIAANRQQGMIDLIEFISSVGEAHMARVGWGSIGFLIAQLNAVPDLDAFAEELSSWTVRLGSSSESNSSGTSRHDLLVGTNTGNIMYGWGGDDVLVAKGGNDYLDSDTGNDILEGGEGDDTLAGGNGADAYLFGIGSGQDTISNIDSDAVGANADTILLSAGITTAGVTLTHASCDLVIRLRGAADKLVVQEYFHDDGNSSAVVENLKFANGAVWDYATVKAHLATITPLSRLTGNSSTTEDSLIGGQGSDSLGGRAGDDILNDGIGVGLLDGEGDDDLMRGGVQSGRLDGGNGNDRLQGQDGDDTLFSQGGHELRLPLIESADMLKGRNWYGSSAYQVDGFDPGNGKHLLAGQADVLVSAMAAFAPPVSGQAALPADYQAALNPLLAANWR